MGRNNHQMNHLLKRFLGEKMLYAHMDGRESRGDGFYRANCHQPPAGPKLKELLQDVDFHSVTFTRPLNSAYLLDRGGHRLSYDDFAVSDPDELRDVFQRAEYSFEPVDFHLRGLKDQRLYPQLDLWFTAPEKKSPFHILYDRRGLGNPVHLSYASRGE